MNVIARSHESTQAFLRRDGIVTALPENELRQSDAVAVAERIFAPHFDDFETFRGVFDNAGIERRYMAMPLDWYLEPRDWQQRTDAYLSVAGRLFEQAASAAIERAGLGPGDIDAVVTVSSTGIATPTLEARAADRIGLRDGCMRLPLFGLGCAGGVSGLSLAARLAGSRDPMTVLLVVVELCSLAFRGDRPTKANVVATALFGDGAVAMVLRPDDADAGFVVSPGVEHRWPDTLGIMGWNVDPLGFEVVFDRAIPPFARRHLRPVVDRALGEFGIDPASLSRLSFHPGGTKVLMAIEQAFELQAGTLDIERSVLRRFGNMSAPTALFILADALTRGFRGQNLVTALGPGFTASMVPVSAT